MQVRLPFDALSHRCPSLALVEDDGRMAALALELLREQGWHCTSYPRASAFLADVGQQDFDAVLLDQRLPDYSGLQVLERLSSLPGPMPPVVMVTSCADDQTLERAFEAGAQDFVLKPYRGRELVARLRALLRRTAQTVPEVREPAISPRGPASLNHHPAVVAGWSSLTERERRCADILLARLGQTVSRSQLREQVWGLSEAVQTRTVDTHISRVRAKLGLCPENGFCLITLYGVGWRLERR